MVQDTDENTIRPAVNLRIQDLAKVKFIIDTGATVNLLEETDFESLKSKVKLQHSSINIYPYKGFTAIVVYCYCKITQTS